VATQLVFDLETYWSEENILERRKYSGIAGPRAFGKYLNKIVRRFIERDVVAPEPKTRIPIPAASYREYKF